MKTSPTAAAMPIQINQMFDFAFFRLQSRSPLCGILHLHNLESWQSIYNLPLPLVKCLCRDFMEILVAGA
jgi:hypothetical protein